MASALLALTGLCSATARADQFHYENLQIGTRAVGMGGAFTGVADDASGIYYNPAGLAFALSNDISGSANAYYTKKALYKNTLCGDDFQENSGGSVPSFFGGLQKLDRYVDGLVFAFGVFSTDNDLKDQDTLIENKQCNGLTIERYHRTSNARANTYFAGAGVGKRVGSNVAWGFGLAYYNSDELVQEYQDVRQTIGKDSAGNTVWKYLESNIRQHLTVYGVQPTFGIQAALPGNLALGLTIKKGIATSQNLQVDSETALSRLPESEAVKTGTAAGGAAIMQKVNASIKSKNPVGSLPTEIRLGFAWFASPVLLWTIDVAYHTAVTDAATIKEFGTTPIYGKVATTDLATGLEYYVLPSFPLRAGVFTNNDARPQVKDGGFTDCDASQGHDKFCNQRDHIDFMGETLFIAWVQPNSQVAVGMIGQQGKGKAQKLNDTYKIQDVVASAYTFAFSATHNL